MRAACLLAICFPLLAGCASPLFDAGGTETVLPVSRAWVDGRIFEYVTTDISDLAMARMMGANHVPALGDAVKSTPGLGLLERVYKFPDEDQISIFQSAPNPVGAENQDRSYSPLWRVVMVRWIDPTQKRELQSEEALLSAEDEKLVSLDVTDIVVNCPITRSADGQALKGVR